MTMMKIESLREMTREELINKMSELSDEQFNLHMRESLKKLDNPLRLRLIRREIARIMTLLREDELNINKLAKSGRVEPAAETSKRARKK